MKQESSETKTEKKEERKRGGVLFDFLSQLSGRVAAGPGGGAAAGLGFLFTKTGLVAVMVIGTTLAGGISLIGYRGLVSADSKGEEGFSSIFEARAKPKAGETGAAQQKRADGASSSLQYLVDANKGSSLNEQQSESAAAGEASGAAADNGAGGQAQGASSASPAANAAAKPGLSLSGGKQLGQLSKGLGAGQSGASYTPDSAAGADKANLSKASNALLANARASQGAGASGSREAFVSRGRQAPPRRSATAQRQLVMVKRDQGGARSSAQAGRTYDGGASQTGTTEENAQAEGEGKAAGAGPKDRPNPLNPDFHHESPAPPSVAARNVTPWQNFINMTGPMLNIAMGLGAAAVAFMGIAVVIEKISAAASATGWVKVLCWIAIAALFVAAAAALAAALAIASTIIGFGTAMMFGPYKQTAAAWPLLAAGGFTLGVVAGCAAAVAAGLALVLADSGAVTALQGMAQYMPYVIGGGIVVATASGAMALSQYGKAKAAHLDTISPGEPGYDENIDKRLYPGDVSGTLGPYAENANQHGSDAAEASKTMK